MSDTDDGKPIAVDRVEEGCVRADDAAFTATTGSMDAASKANADEVASLFDSCVSEDEEECNSVSACGSQDYSQYMDETGRNRPDDTSVFDGIDSGRQTGDSTIVVDAKSDSKIAAVLPTSPVSPTSVIPPEVSDAMAFPPPTAILAPPTLPPTKSCVRLKGLELDLNQPWERSLLRQLEKAALDVTSTTAVVPPQSSQQPLSSPPPRRELILLGHTESRDFGMDYDDSVSLDTNASSTVPTRAQLIHRTLLNPVPQPRVVYRLGDNEDDDKPNSRPAERQHHPRVHSRGDHDQSVTSSLTGLTLQTDDDRDEVSFPAAAHNKIPNQLPGKGKNAPSQQAEQYFLEMEASVKDEEDGYEQYAQDLAASAANTILPDPGCFCLGINMLDYVLPPSAPKNHNGGNGMKSTSARTRLMGVMRPSHLTLVEEEEEAHVLPETIDLRNIRRPGHISRRGKSEPEGTYMVSSPADAPRILKQRRQVVDV